MRYLAHIKSQDRKILLSSVRQRYCAHIYVSISMYLHPERERGERRKTTSHTERNTHAEQSHHITSHIHIIIGEKANQPVNHSSYLYTHIFLAKQPFFRLYQTNHIADAMHLHTYTLFCICNVHNNNNISHKFNTLLNNAHSFKQVMFWQFR